MKRAETPQLIDASQIPGTVLPLLARWVAEESAILADEESPFRAAFIEGDARILLITGENASGKSLAFRLMAQLAQDNGIEPLTLSIRERTGDGTFEMARMRRAMIYGQETTSSTGAVSARVVESGFHNLIKRPIPAILGLDEPEIGLSDGYAEALGEYIGAQAQGIEGNACGVMVVTHSRRLAEGLIRGLNATPSMIALLPNADAACPSVADWIASRETRSVEDLLNLREISHKRYLQMQKILDPK